MDDKQNSRLEVVKNNDVSTIDTLLVHKATPEYLQDLLKDKRQLQKFPNTFIHLDFILEKEITRVREKLFHLNESVKNNENELPEPKGTIISIQEKVLLGPRGLTAKQLEQDLECKLMVRGRGSLRDKRKEDLNRGKPNWEHLDEDLHVLVSVEDYENRAVIKLKRASDTVRAFLEQGVRTPDGEDQIKKRQLMELAIINGTYRAVNQRETPCPSLIFNDPKGGLNEDDKDRQQSNLQLQQSQQQQQQQQLLLQHQSLSMLNNQAAAAAAAQLQTQTLLSRLQSHHSLPANYLYLPNISSFDHIMTTNSSTNSTLSTILQNSNLQRVINASSNAANVVPTASTVSGLPNAVVSTNISMSLNPIAGSISNVALSALSLPMNPNLQVAALTPNVINCNSTAINYDQLAAVASTILNSGSNRSVTNAGSSNANINNTSMVQSSTSTALNILNGTSNLTSAVNLLEYENAANCKELNAGPIKVRSLNRTHPYVRP